MKIAQVAPLVESVPPQLYGGTERIVSWLTEELVRLGHDVTLYASGDSVTAARLVPVTPKALRLEPELTDVLPHTVVLMERVLQDASQYDLIHYHVDHIHYSLLRRMPVPGLTTMHGRMDIPDLVTLYQEFRETPLISISDDQRTPLPWLNWKATIPHGMPMGSLAPYLDPGSYLAFLGRITPEKGLEKAIEIAARVRLPLRIAAKVDAVDQAYFDEKIKPLLDRRGVEFIGEICEDEKSEFLGNAAALLFPIAWPEPFGLVMIEAAARGTPVLAFRSGSVPEVIDDGVSGIVVDNVEEAVAAMPRLLALPRRDVRAAVERRFSVERMARDYLAIYRQLVEERARGREGQVARRPGMADWGRGPGIEGRTPPQRPAIADQGSDASSKLPKGPRVDRQPTTTSKEPSSAGTA